MPGLARILATLAPAAFAASVASGQASLPDIVVIDQERLFQESVLGRSILHELEQRSAELAAENRTIESELVAEERDLTERRSQLSPVEFRALADAFDEKVDRLRSEQDAKTRELVTIRDAGRQNFTQSVGPILLGYMRRTGASVMIDRRSVVATADRVDVTDELIAEIDARAAEPGPGGDLPDGQPIPADPPALAPNGVSATPDPAGETTGPAPGPTAPSK